MTVIVKGKTIPVKWAWEFKATQKLKICLDSEKPLSEVAEMFENAPVIERKSDTEGDKTYTGYIHLTDLSREGGEITLTFRKEAANA